ncbi:MAG TPA: tetratricopeptide repeat protein [Thermodesulfobacteriota bacterium]|nr:tetratricopeptide repeat protein [Thermodesulfobacteriota bacterium]
MKKEIALLVIGIAFAFGFLTGSVVPTLKGTKGNEGSMTDLMTQLPVGKEPISIELMESIEDLKELVREDPKNITAWLKLANIYFLHSRYREAVEAYRRYLSANPENPDVRTNMGIMLRGVGDVDGAIEELRKAAQNHPNHANSRFHLGVVLLKDKKDVKGAINAWEEYLRVESRGERANWVRDEIERLKHEVAGHGQS